MSSKMIALTTKSTIFGKGTIVAFLLITAAGGGLALPMKGQDSQSRNAQADTGTVSGNEYSNDSVGMKYVFPKGWSVDVAGMTAANDIAKKYAETHAQSRRSEDYKHLVWLMISKSEEQANPEARSSIAGPFIILTGASAGILDEHETVAELQNKEKRRIEREGGLVVVTEPTEFSVSGQIFSRIDVTRNGFIYESKAVTIRNNVLIEFQFLAGSRDQLQNLYKSLSTLQFRDRLS
jgi:hypothetical protein